MGNILRKNRRTTELSGTLVPKGQAEEARVRKEEKRNNQRVGCTVNILRSFDEKGRRKMG